MYYGKIKWNGRDPYVEVCDGYTVQRMYGDSESDLRAKIREYGYKSVTELTAKMLRGERVYESQVTAIHKLTN